MTLDGCHYYVVRNEHGAGVLSHYEGRDRCSLDTHGRHPWSAGATSDGKPCFFLDGEPPCYFDGTSLGPDVREWSDEQKFELAATRVPPAPEPDQEAA